MKNQPFKFALLFMLLGGFGAGGWFWLRQSSFVQVKDVTVVGVSGPHSAAIKAALHNAAVDMTTLDVQTKTLRAATSPFADVGKIEAVASVPHKLRIRVQMRTPVALLQRGSEQIPVAADGALMRNTPSRTSLPVIRQVAVKDSLRTALAVAAAAPQPLQKTIRKIEVTDSGVSATVGFNNIKVEFGSAKKPVAQWSAFSKVYNDAWSQAPVELDVSMPNRVFVRTKQTVLQQQQAKAQQQRVSTSSLTQPPGNSQQTQQPSGL